MFFINWSQGVFLEILLILWSVGFFLWILLWDLYLDIDLVVSPLCSRVYLLPWNVLKKLLSVGRKAWKGLLLDLLFLGSTLKVNPEERLSITELVNQLQEIAAARNVNPKSPITEVKMSRKQYNWLGLLSILCSVCAFRKRFQSRFPVRLYFENFALFYFKVQLNWSVSYIGSLKVCPLKHRDLKRNLVFLTAFWKPFHPLALFFSMLALCLMCCVLS